MVTSHSGDGSNTTDSAGTAQQPLVGLFAKPPQKAAAPSDAADTTASDTPRPSRAARECAGNAPDGCGGNCPNGWTGDWSGLEGDSPQKPVDCVRYGSSAAAVAFRDERERRAAERCRTSVRVYSTLIDGLPGDDPDVHTMFTD